jgi:hypothetical protein
MDRKEKNAKKAKLSEYINLGNGRFKDCEIEELESLVGYRKLRPSRAEQMAISVWF